MKTVVAILTALLVLVGPASAQADPEPEPSSGQGGEPEPPSGDGGSGGNATAQEPEPSSASAWAPTCPAAKSNVGDPRVPASQWVILDPHGCLQQTVYKILTSPPACFILKRL